MKVAEGNTIVERKGKELNLYIFHANYDPIYHEEETELTTIKMPASNESHAWDRLARLLGSEDKIHNFRLDEFYPYE